jgi:diaminohydroxyphosphoribosylaminopyrimidine deaminase/5-amino-6-(5-phosphoribosylamino)uracil reductase
MKRCLELASQGLGWVAPNPLVGSIIVHEGKIIGEGYHMEYGGPHAEVNAINSVKDPGLLEDSILYVTLEPCAHFGKTPPCTNLIIEKMIPQVVIGTIDSNPETSGLGIARLEEAGIRVASGVLQKECMDMNRRFFTYHNKLRPYVILKWAQTEDGFMDVARQKDNPIMPTWITGDVERMLVHKWRSEEQSIMVGTNTAEKDNPKLNVREWEGLTPLRIVIDRECRLKPELSLFDQTIPTLVITTKTMPSKHNLEYVNIDFSTNPFTDIFAELHRREIQSVMVEGGNQLLTSIMFHDLWDEARVFSGINKRFYQGVKAPMIRDKPVNREEYSTSILEIYRNFLGEDPVNNNK